MLCGLHFWPKTLEFSDKNSTASDQLCSWHALDVSGCLQSFYKNFVCCRLRKREKKTRTRETRKYWARAAALRKSQNVQMKTAKRSPESFRRAWTSRLAHQNCVFALFVISNELTKNSPEINSLRVSHQIPVRSIFFKKGTTPKNVSMRKRHCMDLGYQSCAMARNANTETRAKLRNNWLGVESKYASFPAPHWKEKEQTFCDQTKVDLSISDSVILSGHEQARNCRPKEIWRPKVCLHLQERKSNFLLEVKWSPEFGFYCNSSWIELNKTWHFHLKTIGCQQHKIIIFSAATATNETRMLFVGSSFI